MSSVTSVSLNCLAVNIAQPIGIERFVRNVISGVRLGDIHTSCYARTSVSNLDQLFEFNFKQNNTQVKLKRIPVGPTVSRILLEMLVLPFFTFKDDVVLSINNFGPLWGKPKQSRIVIIHDVWFMSPEYDGGLLQKWLFRILLGFQIRSCSKILTVSDFSKREISRFFKTSLSGIHIVSNCIGQNIEAFSGSYSQDRLLLIGSDRKNKNAFRSIEGFCKFRSLNPDSAIKLVVVGKYSESFFNLIKTTFSEYMPYIELAGYVDEATLRSLYKNCVGVLFPSLYEGFGIPAIEGLLSGKPVLVSQNTACSEILGDFAVIVDATNPTYISEGITELTKRSVDTMSPEFMAFQQKFMDCETQSKLLTEIMLNVVE